MVVLVVAGSTIRFGRPIGRAQEPAEAAADAGSVGEPSRPSEAEPRALSASRVRGPQRVIVGAHIRNVENIDLASNSYSLSVVLWMKWRPGGLDPTSSFRLANVIDASSLTATPVFDEPVEVDGYLYQRFDVEGTFWHKFWLGTFPLDWQRITLELEDSRHVVDELVYVPDQEASGVRDEVRIPGWIIVEETNEAFESDVGTDYGMGSLSPGTTFPGYRFGLRIERPMSFYVFKILPPILLTLATCFLVFLLKPMYVDARVGTPIAALLTAVFLQLTFTGGLPNVGIMLLLDHVFNLTYTVIFIIALVCMVTTRLSDTVANLNAELPELEGAPRAELRGRIDRLSGLMRRLDRVMLVVLPLAYLVGVAAITFAVRGSYVFEMLGR